MPPIDRNLTNLHISESFYRLMQTDPVDDETLLDGTGSLVTYLTISGTLDAVYLRGDGSQITNINLSASNAFTSSQQIIDALKNATVEVDTLVAQQYVVSSSVYYVTQSWSSGSTIFGNTADDTHQFTGSVFVEGSLTTTGGITSSLFGTASWSTESITASNANTASFIDPLFISASAVQYGFSTPPMFWDNIQNKPADLISGSGQRNILGLGESDSPRFSTIYGTNANLDGNLLVGGTITARTYVISSSVVEYQTIQISGSTKFGDSLDDKHEFTGSLYVTGALVIPTIQTLSPTADVGTIAIFNESLYIYY